jgi:hypothetical protein
MDVQFLLAIRVSCVTRHASYVTYDLRSKIYDLRLTPLLVLSCSTSHPARTTDLARDP